MPSIKIFEKNKKNGKIFVDNFFREIEITTIFNFTNFRSCLGVPPCAILWKEKKILSPYIYITYSFLNLKKKSLFIPFGIRYPNLLCCCLTLHTLTSLFCNYKQKTSTTTTIQQKISWNWITTTIPISRKKTHHFFEEKKEKIIIKRYPPKNYLNVVTNFKKNS